MGERLVITENKLMDSVDELDFFDSYDVSDYIDDFDINEDSIASFETSVEAELALENFFENCLYCNIEDYPHNRLIKDIFKDKDIQIVETRDELLSHSKYTEQNFYVTCDNMIYRPVY